MGNGLDSLQITTWYKAVMAVSGAAFLIVLASQRDTLTILFAGIFLIGLGEWRNHPKKSYEYRMIEGGGTARIKNVVRKTTVLGFLFQFLGALLVLLSVARLFELPIPFGL